VKSIRATAFHRVLPSPLLTIHSSVFTQSWQHLRLTSFHSTQTTPPPLNPPQSFSHNIHTITLNIFTRRQCLSHLLRVRTSHVQDSRTSLDGSATTSTCLSLVKDPTSCGLTTSLPYTKPLSLSVMPPTSQRWICERRAFIERCKILPVLRLVGRADCAMIVTRLLHFGQQSLALSANSIPFSTGGAGGLRVLLALLSTPVRSAGIAINGRNQLIFVCRHFSSDGQ
jgi:hypothetical protein